MSNEYWFKPKRYGWGFTPITWEGWVSTLIFIGLLIIAAYVNDFQEPVIGSKEGFRFLLDVVVLTTLFSLVSKNKLKEKLGWRWGRK